MDKIYNSVIEALIFASDDPITASEIAIAIKNIDGDDIIISPDEVENCINELNQRYEELDLPFSISKIAGGFAYSTKPQYAKYVGYLSTEKSKRRLSQAALETLAIIAYKQPITKPEIESIRGVNSDYIINMLLEKNLVTISGRAETIGRPLLYATTDEFLKYFGLYKITDLPKPREIEEIMNDQDFIEQRQKIMMNLIEDDLAKGTNTEEDENNESEIE